MLDINAIEHPHARLLQQPICHCQGVFIEEIFAFGIESISVETREDEICRGHYGIDVVKFAGNDYP